MGANEFAESIHALSARLENVDEGNERIEHKLDNFINKDLVIELHLNSYNGTAKGTEVL